MKLYHGTAKENLESIKANGLIASVPQDVDFSLFPERGGNGAAVSLAKTIATAVCYGDIVIEVELPEDADVIEIQMFNEILVSGNVEASKITGIYEASPEADWIPENEVTENHVVVGPVKYQVGYAHVIEIKKIA